MPQQSSPNFRPLQLSAIAVGLALVMLGSAQAQEEGDDAAPAGSQVIVQQATGPIEEVVVTGQRTISSLRNEAGRETESFYQRLNAVIDKPEFEIRCQNENPPGSNISRRVCRTRYQEDLMSRAALSTIQGFGSTEEGELVFNGSPFDSQPEMVRMQQQFEQEILQAVNTDPQLNESVVRLMQLKAAVESYETPRQERRNAEREASD